MAQTSPGQGRAGQRGHERLKHIDDETNLSVHDDLRTPRLASPATDKRSTKPCTVYSQCDSRCKADRLEAALPCPNSVGATGDTCLHETTFEVSR